MQVCPELLTSLHCCSDEGVLGSVEIPPENTTASSPKDVLDCTFSLASVVQNRQRTQPQACDSARKSLSRLSYVTHVHSCPPSVVVARRAPAHSPPPTPEPIFIAPIAQPTAYSQSPTAYHHSSQPAAHRLQPHSLPLIAYSSQPTAHRLQLAAYSFRPAGTGSDT